jgi:threonine dehydrogenase-like Zn-dependent dehydrogenase
MSNAAPVSTRPDSTRALWYVGPGRVELRTEPLGTPGPDQVLVRTLYSGVSRGTERLVASGQIGESEWQRMRCPLQAGAFPFPVKYGYCATGIVEDGPAALRGRTVFVLHPHQERFLAPATMAVPVPDAVPVRRAVLAANMETALNALWDSGAAPADRIVVIGGGVLGLLVGTLAAQLPGAEVTLVDVASERRELARALGMGFADPVTAPSEADVVFHTSATSKGLDSAIAAAGLEGTIMELSWFGSAATSVHLGGAFHSKRLRLLASQVGQVSDRRRARWSYRRRLEAALALLADPRLELLLDTEIAFNDTPATLPGLLAAAHGLAPVIRY